MIQRVSFKGNSFTDMFKEKKTPYREKVTETFVIRNGHKFARKVNWIKEYENPNAGEILKRIRTLKHPYTNDREEFLRLSDELGSFRIIDLDFEKKLDKQWKEWRKGAMWAIVKENAKTFLNKVKTILR